MNKLANLKLKFKTKPAEQEFIIFRRPLFQRFFLFIIVLICIMLTSIITSSNGSLPLWVAVLSVCVPSALLIISVTFFKAFKYLEFCIISFFLVIYGGLFYLQSQYVPPIQSLSSGYFFGFIERVIIERLPLFHHKALFGIFACIMRLTLNDIQSSYGFLLGGLIPFFGLLLDFIKEKSERKIFKALYESKETLAKFKELFKCHLPENILIISVSLEEYLFANDSFQKNFSIAPSSGIQGFLKQFTLEKSHSAQATEKLREVRANYEQRINMHQNNQEMNPNIIIDSTNPYLDTKNGFTDLYSLLEALRRIKHGFNAPFDFIFSYHKNEETSETIRTFNVKVFPFQWDDQKTFAIVINDMTEHYTIVNLKLADENKDKIVAMVSHELRTPLNGILGMVQLMEKETTQPLFIKYLKICSSSAKLLLSLVNSILDLGQLKHNKFKLHPAKYRLRDVMSDIVSLFEFQCQQKQLYLRLKIDKTLPKFIHTDKNRLAQIIINLVGNALKFTFEGGITINVDQDPQMSDSVKFSVRDTGIGIHEQEKNKLFKMYGKLEGSNNINTQGVGLGLHISNTLAKLLNEDSEGSGINVESEPQKGSTFMFRLKKKLVSLEDSSIKTEEPNMILKKESILSKLSKHKERIFEEVDSFEENDIEPILSFNETDDDKDLNEQGQDGIFGLSGKIVKYSTLVNSSQLNLETSRFSRCFVNHMKDASVTLGNLDQTYASPRMHLLSYASPFIRQIRRRATFNIAGAQILIADDNAFNLMVAKELIESQGIHTQTALNGDQAIKEITKRNQDNQPFRLILMDCEMPVMNGFEATKILVKKMKKGELTQVPIVALTANNVDTIKEECLKAGMVECLSKPLLESDLKRIVLKYIKA